MIDTSEYDALARDWARLVVEMSELISKSDKLGVPMPNSVHFLWLGLRGYLDDLPELIRQVGTHGTTARIEDS